MTLSVLSLWPNEVNLHKNLKPMNLLKFITIVTFFSLTACHKKNTYPTSAVEGPVCDLYHARPVAIGYFNSIDTNWTSYTYDNNGKITLVGDIRYIYLQDTLQYDYSDQGYDAHAWRHYKPNGIVDNVHVIDVKHGTTPLDTVITYDYKYTYDDLNEMILTVAHRVEDGIPGIVTTDSTVYTWQDGNMIRSVNYENNTVIDFDYIPNTNGWGLMGQPYRQANWIYTIGMPVLSKNQLRRKVTNSRDTTFYDPHFNTYGTLKYIDINIHSAGNEPTHTAYVFRYECY
ncbi:MAG: hypothetical protein BGO69_08790 [Bacteroidetes bacterium 46-16]|nr:MAG: hypothetical protein BGO69_08790 [Bacteroidetes bacterium 46-16]